MLSSTKAPLTMETTEKRATDSMPGSSVDMEVMRDGKPAPAELRALPGAPYAGSQSAESGLPGRYAVPFSLLRYDSVDHRFSYSGTTGFTSRMDVGSKPLSLIVSASDAAQVRVPPRQANKTPPCHSVRTHSVS
jgi:hypothetical protein